MKLKNLLIPLLAFLLSCSAPQPLYTLELPVPVQNEKKPKPLTDNERQEIVKKLKAYRKLLEILGDIEKEIHSKQKKADFFGFALSEDDKVSLDAAEILLDYIAKTKQDIRIKITLAESKLK